MNTLKKTSNTGVLTASSRSRNTESKRTGNCALWFESTTHRFSDRNSDDQMEEQFSSDLNLIDSLEIMDELTPPKPRK